MQLLRSRHLLLNGRHCCYMYNIRVCFWRTDKGVHAFAAYAQGCAGISSTSGWR